MIRLCAAMVMLALSAAGAPAQTSDEDERFNAGTQAVRDRDFRLAVALFEPLAEADVPDAQFNLAVLLREGRGRPQNHVEALYWSALALLADGAYAQNLVEQLLDTLPSGAREEVMERLLKRLTAQAEAGQMDAPRKLARIYTELMAEPDARFGYIWFSICYALGENRCAEGRDSMAGQIEPEELIDVQIEAGETFAALPFSSAPMPVADTDGAQGSGLR